MSAELIFETIGENSLIVLKDDSKKYVLSPLQPSDSLIKEYNKIKESPEKIAVLTNLINNKFTFIKYSDEKYVGIFNRCKYTIQNGVPKFNFSLSSEKNDITYLEYNATIINFCNYKYEFIDRNIPIIDLKNYTGRDSTIKKIQLNLKYKKNLSHGYNIFDIDKSIDFYDDSFKFKTLHKRDRSKEFIILLKDDYSAIPYLTTVEEWIGSKFDTAPSINHKLIDNVKVDDERNPCYFVHLIINDITIKYPGISGIILKRDTLYLHPYIYDARYKDDYPVSEIDIQGKLIISNNKEYGKNKIIELVIKENI